MRSLAWVAAVVVVCSAVAAQEPPFQVGLAEIDITAPAHVLVFRPLIRILEERGAEVEVTARSYAQTLELLELHARCAAPIR